MRGFIFLGDLIQLEEPGDRIELIEGHVLRKAEGEEIDHIKRELNSLGSPPIMIPRHEALNRESEPGHFTPDYLEREHWKYWIIEVDVFRVDSDFLSAISLCSTDLTRLFDSMYGEDGKPSGRIFQHNITYNFFEEVWINNYEKSFSKKDAQEINLIFNLIKEFKEIESNYLFISKALNDFSFLKMVSKKTPFYFVSMFSIIESLITHNPNNESKSINHQLATKLTLLNKRFEQPLSLNDFFKSPASFEKTIKLLYKFRSDIAHGNFVDFEKLQAIENKEKASDFLYSLLKKLIIQALREPVLLADLKNV